MLLKVFSANIKASIPVCSLLCRTSNHISTISRSKLCETSSRVTGILYCQRSQYSTENAASDISKRRNRKTEPELSQHEIDLLKQDPDDFGTLSTFKQPLKVNDTNKNEASSLDSDESKNENHSTAAKKQTIQQYEAEMKELFEKGHVLEVIELFKVEVLQKQRMHAPVRIYKWLIAECVRLHEFDKAIDIYDQMVGRKLAITSDIFEKLVVAYEQSNLNVSKLNSIQKTMAKNHIQLNGAMYNAMIRIYARSTQWQTALTLADEMKAKRMPYDLDTFNALFECCSHSKDNGFYRMIELWHEMHHNNLTPDVSTYNAIIKCIKKCELTNVDKLKAMLETMRMQCSTAPSDETFIEDGRPNLLLNPPYIGYLFPLEHVERPEHRLLILGGLTKILHDFKAYDIQPTLETITGLLGIVPNTFVAHQKVIGLLKKNRTKPDLHMFNVLLTKNCEAQNFRNAMEIIEMMNAADIEVDLVSYGLLALSCTNEEEANEFFDIFISRNKPIDVDILNAMLKNACALKENNFVICILRLMISKQIEPTVESIRMVDEYHARVFQNLRSYRVVSKKMRNECFKLTRECRHWKKYFRQDQSKDSSTSKQHVHPKRQKNFKKRPNFRHHSRVTQQDDKLSNA